MTKMTYVSALEVAINAVSDAEVREKLEALKASVEKRNKGDHKPTKTQKENEVIKAEILNYLSDGEKHTVTEIMANVPALGEASNQKATALVSALYKAELIKREEIKRKAYFSLA